MTTVRNDQNVGGATADRPGAHYADSTVEERYTAPTAGPLNAVLRTAGVVAGGVAVIFAAVALIRIDWNAGISSPAVDVGGMPFTPVVALVTLVLGVIAMAGSAGPGRAEKLGLGAVLVCVGVAILVAGNSRADLDLATGHGWLALVVGVVVVASGALLRDQWKSRRSVRNGENRA